MQTKDCPYITEANRMCMVLIRQITKVKCWYDMEKIISAILKIRQEEKKMVEEWKHHNPDPNDEIRKTIIGQ